MKLMAVRRAQLANTGRSEVPLPPAPPPHPGYAPNAALHAIKRHAQEFAGPKAIAVSDSQKECIAGRPLVTLLFTAIRDVLILHTRIDSGMARIQTAEMRPV